MTPNRHVFIEIDLSSPFKKAPITKMLHFILARNILTKPESNGLRCAVGSSQEFLGQNYGRRMASYWHLYARIFYYLCGLCDSLFSGLGVRDVNAASFSHLTRRSGSNSTLSSDYASV